MSSSLTTRKLISCWLFILILLTATIQVSSSAQSPEQIPPLTLSKPEAAPEGGGGGGDDVILPHASYYVITLDGRIHSLDMHQSTEHGWSKDAGGPLLSSSSSMSYATTDTAAEKEGEEERERADSGNAHVNHCVVPSLAGNLYMYRDQKIMQMPISMRQLVHWSPFVSSDGSTLYVSSKKTHMLSFDIDQGDRALAPVQNGASTQTPLSGKKKLKLLRVDYSIESINRNTSAKNWNVTFSDFVPAMATRTYPQHRRQSEENMLLFSTQDGYLYVARDNNIKEVKITQFDSHPVAFISHNDETGHVTMHRVIHLVTTTMATETIDQSGRDRIFITKDENLNQIYAIELHSQRKGTSSSSTKSGNERLLLASNANQSSVSKELSTAIISFYDNDDSVSNMQDIILWSLFGIHELDEFEDYESCLNMDLLQRLEYQVDRCESFDQFGHCIPHRRMGKGRHALPSPRNTLRFIAPLHFDWSDTVSPNTVIITVGILLCLTFITMTCLNRKNRNGESIASETKAIDTKSLKDSVERVQHDPQEAAAHMNMRDHLSESDGTESSSSSSFSQGNETRIGNLVIYTNKVIGRGSNGTMVFEGVYSRHRRCAVKRMLREFVRYAEREIRILIESDHHGNIVRYYAQETDDQFIYLALELCPMTLAEFIQQRTAVTVHSKNIDLSDNAIDQALYTSKLGMLLHSANSFDHHRDNLELIQEMIRAVGHLHSMNILHRDLKPQNVLLDVDGHVKLSDMGLGKDLNAQHSNTTANTLGIGTGGWLAPEVLLQLQEYARQVQLGSNANSLAIAISASNATKSKKVDIYALGLLIYFVASGGSHPFGTMRSEQESRTIKSIEKPPTRHELYQSMNKHLEITMGKKSPNPLLACDLISQCLAPNPRDRPSIDEILQHPFLWDDSKKLQFISDVSDQLGKEKRDSAVNDRLQMQASILFNGHRRWSMELDKTLLSNLSFFRKYDYAKVWDLLRCIRNIRSHYSEYSSEVQQLLGPDIPRSGLIRYFDAKFPRLFFAVWTAVKDNSTWLIDKEQFMIYSTQ